jgi:antitoxin component of RelBE/YafQ-DinJ toxin-antitoxin module
MPIRKAVTIRLTDTQKKKGTEIAENEGMTLSEWVRTIITEKIKESQ